MAHNYNLRDSIKPTNKSQTLKFSRNRSKSESNSPTRNPIGLQINTNISLEDMEIPQPEITRQVNEQTLPGNHGHNIELLIQMVQELHTNMDEKFKTLAEELNHNINLKIDQVNKAIETVRTEVGDNYTELLEKIETTRLNSERAILNAVEAQLITVNTRITDVVNQVDDIQRENTNRPSSAVSQPIVIAHLSEIESYTPKIPKFDGKNNNPMMFLSKLENYLKFIKEQRNVRGQQQPLDLEQIFDQALTYSANSWWQIIKHKVNNFTDFSELFTTKYWSDEIQWGIRQRMDTEQYLPSGKLNRTDYFIDRAVILQAMIPSIPEPDIVRTLSRHFGERIRNAVRVQNIKTIQEMEELLNREDTEDRNDSLRAKKPFHRNNPIEPHNRERIIGDNPRTWQDRRYQSNYRPNYHNQQPNPTRTNYNRYPKEGTEPNQENQKYERPHLNGQAPNSK